MLLDKKLSGVYRHHVMNKREPLVRGFDDFFMAPHSRYTEACREDILSNPNLKVLADSKEAGIYIVMEKEGKQIFVMGHPEYDRVTKSIYRGYINEKDLLKIEGAGKEWENL